MKKLLTLLVAILIITTIFAQKRDITLDDLWQNYTFYPSYIGGFNSMNDGEHYSTMERTEDEQEIIKALQQVKAELKTTPDLATSSLLLRLAQFNAQLLTLKQSLHH